MCIPVYYDTKVCTRRLTASVYRYTMTRRFAYGASPVVERVGVNEHLHIGPD
jgi:hypothetical protein